MRETCNKGPLPESNHGHCGNVACMARLDFKDKVRIKWLWLRIQLLVKVRIRRKGMYYVSVLTTIESQAYMCVFVWICLSLAM